MSRAAYLDRAYGEARGVVTLDGRPERLIYERDGDIPCQRLGARSVARVAAVDKGLKTAFLHMPEGPDAAAPMEGLTTGAAVLIEVAAEARGEKGCVANVMEAASGPPVMVRPAPSIEARLEAWAGAPPALGPEARELADLAQAAALQTVHALPGGGSVAVEPTRALTAIDVDVGARGGADAGRAMRQVNLAAIAAGARLLRLKGLGGLVVFDLAGRGHDGAAMTAAAKAAFEADGPGVSIGPISRFGLFELALPWRVRPAAERLLAADGRLAPAVAAAALLRALEREGRANPGARLTGVCAPEVADAAGPYLDELAGRLGSRFVLESRPGAGREAFEAFAQ